MKKVAKTFLICIGVFGFLRLMLHFCEIMICEKNMIYIRSIIDNK